MKSFLILPLLIALSTLLLRGEDEVLPTAHPVSRYTEIWADSPFNREVIKAASEVITSDFAQTLTLEGIVNDDTLGPIAYVRDNAENKPIVITSAKSESHPYTIISANLVNNPEETKVTITDGKETGEIGYVIAKLTQPIQQIPVQPTPQAQPQGERNRPGKNNNPTPPGNADADAIPANRLNASKHPLNPLVNPISKPEDSKKPASATPALNQLDQETRRRRVPLPGPGN